MSNFHVPNLNNKKIHLNIYRQIQYPQDNTFRSNANLNSAINPTYQSRSPVLIPVDKKLEDRNISYDSSHKSSSIITSPLNFNQPITIQNLLIILFKGREMPTSLIHLSEIEFQIFDLIVKRKFFRTKRNILPQKIKEKQLTSQVEWMIQQFNTFKSLKRVEENNKFVFKSVFKGLKKQFIKKQNLRNNETGIEVFLRYYFLEDATKNGRTVWNYDDPLNTKQSLQSLNNKFLMIAFAVDKFRDDFFDFMNKNLLNSYMRNISKKFLLFFQPHNSMIQKYEKDKADKQFIKYLRKQKRIKLPWCKQEIVKAMNHFEKHINKLLPRYQFNLQD